MPMISQRTLCILVFGTLLAVGPIVSAQLISYESFTGIAPSGGLVGSGADATGWTDGGWNGGSDVHFRVVAPTPRLTYQVGGGGLIDGSDRAVQLTTNPEPIAGDGPVT